MIPLKVTERIMDYIDLAYPGGVKKFTEAGGDLTYLPNHLLVSFPKKNEKLKQGISQHFKDIPIFFFSDPFIVDPKVFIDLRNDIIEILMGDEVGLYAQSVSVTQRSCYVFIQSTANLPKALVKDIHTMVDHYELPRVVFYHPNQVPEIWECLDTEGAGDSTSEKPFKSAKNQDKKLPKQDEQVISTDMITDLKIVLNKEQDVLDFLRSLEG